MSVTSVMLVCQLLRSFSSQAPTDETVPLTRTEIQGSISSHLRFESDSVSRFLIYRGFIVAFNCRTKTPSFTIHRLTPDQISPENKPAAKRRSTFWLDKAKLEDCSATNRDYTRSGFDRGHMVPAGDFYWNQMLKSETFVLTNISPQTPQLNRGIWNRLEESIRQKVATLSDTAYVITGTIFNDDSYEMIGFGNVGVPHYFYKIVFFPNQKLIYAFMFSNQVASYEGSLFDFQVTIDAIESITKEDFFDRTEHTMQVQLESALLRFENN